MAQLERFESILQSAVAVIALHPYISFAALIAIHLCVYTALRSRSYSRWKSDPLKISEIYIYPIKSLRATQLSRALATKHGFEYDRRFMLLQVTSDGYTNMAVSHYSEMTQFLTSITLPKNSSEDGGSIRVEFLGSGNTKTSALEIPLRPNTAELEPFTVNMHGSPTQAFKMSAEYHEWFSACFGYEVVLAYLGNNLRGVLFEDLKLTRSNAWLSRIGRSVPLLGNRLPEDYQITFADCCPYLIVSKTSLSAVSARLPEGEEMDVTKFRPNIVLEGAANAWEEDYWGAINVNGAEMILAHNCVRCQSINIDYKTGKPGTGESGQVLKKLQKDRRVDTGAKWSPVFGRYSFWNTKHPPRTLAVGDKVYVTKLNKERTQWSWPGLS